MQGGINVITGITKNIKKLEEDMIILAENQMEFEKYLKDIKSRIIDIQSKLK